MKLACASGSFHHAIERGELTQLEFLDLCARELTCDGVVLDVRHFPRTDGDYLAQVKKMAADRGLTLAALADESFFAAPDAAMRDVLQRAVTLGAPLVAAPLVPELDRSWSDQLARLGAASSLAKAANVTLAVRNAPNTYAATAHDYKRAAKEADSAWLRFGPEPQALDAASDSRALSQNTVLLWSDLGTQTAGSIGAAIAAFGAFRGHVVIDDRTGDANVERARGAIAAWREMLNRK